MTGALNTLRRRVTELLERYELHAVTAMEPVRRRRWEGAVIAVSLSRVVCEAGGFRDYLGLCAQPETGTEAELYGKAVELTLALDVYAPRDGGERACQETMAVMAEAVACHGAGGLPVLELTAGQVEFLEQDGLYRLPVSCRCKGWLVARRETGDTLKDIEVRGRMS